MNEATLREKILMIRFSALGDVAMVVPVVKAFLLHHPDKEILMLSDEKMSDLFFGIERLIFIGASLKGEHRGFLGIIRLFNTIRKQYQFDKLVDLHGVLRTHVLRMLFGISGKRTAMIDKGRFEKFALTRKEIKIFRPLKHATDRYLDVFASIGFSVDDFRDDIHQVMVSAKSKKRAASKQKKKIGFTPFAKHDAKMYSLDRFKEVISHFDSLGHELYFFGGKGAEGRIIREWSKEFSNVVPLSDHIGFREELQVMQQLDLMVTMDSANMHLASLVEVPVVSVWGATHPYAGFYGYNQDPSNAVQVGLSCRPCSVFGNKTCWRGDHACMNGITTAMVIAKIEEVMGRV